MKVKKIKTLMEARRILANGGKLYCESSMLNETSTQTLQGNKGHAYHKTLPTGNGTYFVVVSEQYDFKPYSSWYVGVDNLRLIDTVQSVNRVSGVTTPNIQKACQVAKRVASMPKYNNMYILIFIERSHLGKMKSTSKYKNASAMMACRYPGERMFDIMTSDPAKQEELNKLN